MASVASYAIVFGVLLIGFGLIWTLNASLESRNMTVGIATLILGGVGVAMGAFFLPGAKSLSGIPLAFVEVAAVLIRG